MANWQNCPAVELVTDQDGCPWVFKGTQVPLYSPYEQLASGATVDDFAERFDVAVEQAVRALKYEADELHDYRLDYPQGVPFARVANRPPGGPYNTAWITCPAVEQATGRLGGAWVFKHSRLALYVLYYHLAGGSTIEEFNEWYGTDTGNVVAVLEHEANKLREAWSAYADIV